MTDYLARAEALAPRIQTASDEIERERRLTAPVLAALHEAGFYRLLLPKSLNGAELDPPTFFRIIETFAKADGSTAWCLAQNTICSLAAAFLPEASAREMFADPKAILAWGPGPARALVVPGGYRVTGSWSFASGGRHATWLGAHCPVFEVNGTPRLGANSAPVERTILFPAREAPMSDIWNVIGLRGTGSDAYEVTDLFVPDGFTLIRDDPAARREQGPLYAMTTNIMYACAFASIALGLARGLLDALIVLVQDKTPRGYHNKLRDSAVLQSAIAENEARLRAARMYLLGTAGEVWQAVERTNAMTLEQRLALRLAASHASRDAIQVADAAYHAAGATAIFDRNPFERRFRDIHAVGQQVQARHSHFETAGRLLLGLDADTQFV